MGEGVIGWVAANRRAVIVNDPAHDDRHATEFAANVGVQPRHLVAAPLIGGDEVLGAIELIDKRDAGEPTRHRAASPRATSSCSRSSPARPSRAIQLARTRNERENQNRLASIGQMLAGVLHDLKTPMTIISGYAQLMAQMQDARQREQYVEQILRQFDLMSGMTREVLAFARGETNVLVRKVYLHRFLEEVMTQLEHALAGRNIALGLDAPYTGIAYFDEQKMLRVVHNLARNAAEAMPTGGEFRIATRRQRRAPGVRVRRQRAAASRRSWRGGCSSCSPPPSRAAPASASRSARRSSTSTAATSPASRSRGAAPPSGSGCRTCARRACRPTGEFVVLPTRP